MSPLKSHTLFQRCKYTIFILICIMLKNINFILTFMDASDRKVWEQTQRKNRLVDIAEEVFFSKGYNGTTIPMIAAAAGYNKRTIYLYFKDKEALFLAVVLRGLKQLHQSLRTAVAAAASVPSSFTSTKAL